MSIKNYWEYNEKQNTHVMEFPFGSHKTYFELDEIASNSYILNFYQSEQEKIAIDISREKIPDFTMDGDKYHQASIKGDINYAKTIVEITSNNFYNEWHDPSLHVDPKFINDNLKYAVNNAEIIYEQIEFSENNRRLKETTDKMGFVQGVCECVAALGDDYTLGKKLLTEMNVNKDMAQKFANPETFKKLEQGIFTQKQEQKLEQTQGVKR